MSYRRRAPATAQRVAWVAAPAAVLAILAGPAAYAVTPLQRAVFGPVPMAGPPAASGSDGTALMTSMGGTMGVGTLHPALLSYVEKNQGRATYLLAVNGSMAAEATIANTGKAVMAMGGYTYSDPVPTVAQLRDLVARGKLRYVAFGGIGAFTGGGLTSQRNAWITRSCTMIPPSVYGGPRPPNPAVLVKAMADAHIAIPTNGKPPKLTKIPKLPPVLLAFLNSQTLYDCAKAR